ncbi:DUF2268 domain-containing putative Zn-dependent protease [Pullulanibacillus sp. KACC 23026]|uniref:DUF2268 domain-containing putative Zn-dependent protease n=1 Tax=Pullulanibacillus sp. KACC 23026 TaxID=3028315 RepID=UPI0023B1FACE|nr:DUF2268 domain-containing putative Zn-dependent protease [Pullulanibacillus sp. KACC 23026]WEG13533.1 DUF2268 domain-containing putative Zn-dependent protease [Pullulanibacillus sp. KACC 23026]
MSAVRLNTGRSRRELVLDIFNLTENQLDELLFFGMFQLDSDAEQLKQQLRELRLLGFETFIKEELELLHGFYPSHKAVKFELFLLDEKDEFVKTKLGGVSAFTEWNGRMVFVVEPDERVRQTLKSVITHEYHHHWRMSALKVASEEESLLDRLVLEGLAEHFVRLRLGEEFLGPYREALSEEQARRLWETTYKYHVGEMGDAADPYMFGHPDNGLPFWGGYALGYYLVKWYLEEHEEISIEELTVLPSEAFMI